MTFLKRPLPETKSAPFRGASTEQISLAGAAAHEADDEGGCGQNDQHGPDAHDPDRQLLDAGDEARPAIAEGAGQLGEVGFLGGGVFLHLVQREVDRGAGHLLAVPVQLRLPALDLVLDVAEGRFDLQQVSEVFGAGLKLLQTCALGRQVGEPGLDVHILGGDVLHLLALVHEVARLRGGFEEARVVVLRDADGEGEGAARAGVRGFAAGFQIASGGAHGVGEGGAGGVKVLALDGEVGCVDELCARLRGLGAEGAGAACIAVAHGIGASTGLDGHLGCGKGAVHVVHRVGGVGGRLRGRAEGRAARRQQADGGVDCRIQTNAAEQAAGGDAQSLAGKVDGLFGLFGGFRSLFRRLHGEELCFQVVRSVKVVHLHLVLIPPHLRSPPSASYVTVRGRGEAS